MALAYSGGAAGHATGTTRAEATYLLPLRWQNDAGLDELSRYLHQLAGQVQVLVIDGSPPELFVEHQKRFPGSIRHVPVVPPPGENGKVAAVVAGLRLAETEAVIIADDDVRYQPSAIARVVAALESVDLVRPQNYFLTLPWHARWDTGRTLLNRALGADYPGTLVVRRSALVATQGYDSRVLFENLELMRTIAAAGGTERSVPHIYVGRLPPSARHFLSQRVRQAYDDFAQPGRLLVELSILPLLVLAILRTAPRGRPVLLIMSAGCVVALAEKGRRSHGGRAVFGRAAAVWAPLWVLERSICIWIALCRRLSGGIPYAGTKLSIAAHSGRHLRSLHAGKISRGCFRKVP